MSARFKGLAASICAAATRYWSSRLRRLSYF